MKTPMPACLPSLCLRPFFREAPSKKSLAFLGKGLLMLPTAVEMVV